MPVAGAANGPKTNRVYGSVCALIGKGDVIPKPLLDAISAVRAEVYPGDFLAHRDVNATDCPGEALTTWVHSPQPPAPPTPAPPPPSAPEEAVDTLWYPIDNYQHTWWVDDRGHLLHNFQPGKVEDFMAAPYNIREVLDRTQPVRAAIRPNTFGTVIEVRAVTTTARRLLVLVYTPGPGWAARVEVGA